MHGFSSLEPLVYVKLVQLKMENKNAEKFRKVYFFFFLINFK